MSCAWFILTEVRANAETDFPGPPDAAIFVECSVAERNIYAALDRISSALSEQGFRVIDITRCIRYDLDDWDFEAWPKDSSHRISVERLVDDGTVQYGPFCWSDGDEDPSA